MDKDNPPAFPMLRRPLLQIWAWLLGRRLVALIDFDGDVTICLERFDILGRPFVKRRSFNIRNVLLNEDGSITGGSYVKQWVTHSDYRRSARKVNTQ